jgi:hypothetical protein
MQENNKRKSKIVGMNEDKKDAFKRLREARSGARRLDQAIEVIFLFLKN